MGVAIEVGQLSAWFGRTQALFSISLNAAANHATAIIGPSDRKSTRLNSSHIQKSRMPSSA